MKYHVERSVEINASLETVRLLTEDFHNWHKWSPWTIAEPDCPTIIDGTPGKVGHTMNWDGEVIGSGVNTLTQNDTDALAYDLEFLTPFKSKAKTQLLFAQTDQGVKVTWTMDSAMPFFLFFMVPTMKNWIGMDYDRGLRMLKEVAEKGSVKAKTTNNGIVDIEGFSYVGIQRTVPMDDMPAMMQEDFEKIVHDIVQTKGKGAKHWVTVYPKFDMRSMEATYIAAVSDEDLTQDDLGPEYSRGSIRSSKALEIKHDGSYDFLGNAWSMGMMYTRAKKMKVGGFPFEQYWNSPLEVAPEELKTSIFFPLKG